jgi:hypothetical protein
MFLCGSLEASKGYADVVAPSGKRRVREELLLLVHVFKVDSSSCQLQRIKRCLRVSEICHESVLTLFNDPQLLFEIQSTNEILLAIMIV